MYHVTKCSHTKPWTITDTLLQHKQWKGTQFRTYPTKDSLRAADTLAKAKLRDLLHHITTHETVFSKAAGKIFKRFS